MAQEKKRGCGYRKIGGLYLCGGGIWVECDRLPLRVGHCPTCGAGIHFTRAFTEINALRLFGSHDYSDRDEKSGIFIQRCHDKVRPCHVCDPKDEPAFIMMVGSKYYTPESFIREAREMGVSKKIPFIPKNLELGRTVVYLAHPKAVEVREALAVQQAMAIVEDKGTMQPRLLDAETKPTYALGIFCAFIPTQVEKLIKQSEATEETLEALRKRGITPVLVPDDDPDHR